MVKTRGSKSKLLENEPEAEDVVADDVKESVNQGTVRRNETSGWEGRGGPWCQPPGKLSSSMDVELWLGRVDDFLTANAIPEERWVPILKSLVDDKIYRSLRSFGPNCSYEQLTTHLSRRFGREDSLFIRQLQFTQRVQKQGESMEDFADELQCVGSELKKSDDDLLSQFVIGLRDSSVQRHLVERRPLSFEEAVLLAKQFSTLQMSVGKLKKGPVRMTSNVIETLVNDGNGFDDTDGQQFMTVLGQMEKRLSQLETSRNEEKQRELESVQGHSVPSRNVPRNKTNATCFVCGSTGHFSRDCQQRRSQHKVKFSGNPTETTMLFDRRSTEVQRPTLPMVSLRIGDGNVVRALVDTGAYTSIIRKDLVRHLKIQVQPWKRGNFSSVNGQRVIPIGHATFKIECLGADTILHAAVLKNTPFPLVLGVSTMKKLHLHLGFSLESTYVSRQEIKEALNAESDSARHLVLGESEKSDKPVEGKCNELADALSRTVCHVGENSDDLVERMLCLAAPEAISKEKFRALQLGDPSIARLIGTVEGQDASHQKWDELVPFATFAMNTTEQESTKWSPFELVYGRQPMLPEESRLPWPLDSKETFEEFRDRVKQWRIQAKEFAKVRFKKKKRCYDNGRKPNVLFEPRQLFMVRRHLRKIDRSAKLLPRHDGPFQIVEKLSELNYRVAAVSSESQKTFEPSVHRTCNTDEAILCCLKA
uniref:CCHC-type domain-containing protein n=1 Tax=Trichuris muris TaxID=70415 RepID=A0A5S6Q176_TRIMR